MRHISRTFLRYGLFVLALFLTPVHSAFAVDLNWDAATPVTIGSATYTIASGSAATSLTVGTTTLTVTIPSGSTFTLVSSDKYQLSSSNGTTETCSATQNLITLTGPVTSAIITPTTVVCTPIGRSGDSTAPAAPTSISISATSSAVALTWVDPTDQDLSSIEVLRNSPPSTAVSGTPLSVVAKGVRTYTDTNVNANTAYTYILRSKDNSGNTRNSDQIAVTTAVAPALAGGGGASAPAAPPTAPVVVPTTPVTAPAPTPTAPPSSTVGEVASNTAPSITLPTFMEQLGSRRSATKEATVTSTYITNVLFGGSGGGSVPASMSASDTAVENKLAAMISYGYNLSKDAQAKGEREVAGTINDLTAALGSENVKEAVADDTFFTAADAMLTGDGIKTAKAARVIDAAAALKLEKKLLPAFWVLTGIKASEIVKAKGTQKYEDFFDAFSKAVYAVRMPTRDLKAERTAIKFVRARLPIVNRELAKQGVSAVTVNSSLFWNFTRATISIDQSGVKNLF